MPTPTAYRPIAIDADRPYQIVELPRGLYVIGCGLLCSAASRAEGRALIRQLNDADQPSGPKRFSVAGRHQRLMAKSPRAQSEHHARSSAPGAGFVVKEERHDLDR
jgi:hypothetical protein